MNNELTVVEGLLIGNASAQQQAGRDDAAGNLPGAPADQGPYYRSQKEVDAAFAKRLEAERRKWAKRQDAASQTSQALAAGQPQSRGVLSTAQNASQQDSNQASDAAEKAVAGETDTGDNPDGQAAAADLNTPLAQLAMRLLAEEQDIKQVFPQFDLESFLALSDGIRQALTAGKSLWSVFAAVYAEAVRKQAEEAALEQIRNRNSSVPDVLRSGGAAGNVGMDYANMTSEQFGRLRKSYETEMRKGKKVKP